MGELAGYLLESSESEDEKLRIQAERLYGGPAYLQPYLNTGMNVLDVGCGTGTILREIGKRIQPGLAIGIDADERRIATIQKEITTQAPPAFKVQVGSATRLDFLNGSFDLSHCRYLLMHLRDPEKAIQEMARVTKKGGLVIAHEAIQESIEITPSQKNFEHLLSEWNKECYEKGQNPSIGTQLKQLFLSAGLVDVEEKLLVHRITHGSEAFQTYMDCYRLELDSLREGLQHRISAKIFDAAGAELASLSEGSILHEFTIVAVGRKL